MKKMMIALLAFIMIPYTVSFAQNQTYKVFTPSGGNLSEFVQSGENKFRYFILGESEPMYFSVDGPTKLKIRVRSDILDKGFTIFEIQIWEGDQLIEGKRVKTGPSNLTALESGRKLGLSRDVFFDAAKGLHNYTVRIISEDAKKFYLRFYQTRRAKNSISYSGYRPTQYNEKITLKSSKNSSTYYIADNTNGVKVRAIGPTEIVIYCRANFDETMKGKSKFALGVYENDLELMKFSGIAEKSKTMIYEERSDLIPSKLHKFNLKVPAGSHEFEIRKVNSAASSLSVRFKMSDDSLGKKK